MLLVMMKLAAFGYNFWETGFFVCKLCHSVAFKTKCSLENCTFIFKISWNDFFEFFSVYKQNNKMNKIQPLKVYKLYILVLSICVWPDFLYVLLSKWFPQQFVLAPEHLWDKSSRITLHLTSITNPCTFVALTTFWSSFGFRFQSRGLRVRGELSTIRQPSKCKPSDKWTLYQMIAP